MTPSTHPAVFLYGGIAALLVAATLIGLVLRRTVTTERGRATVANLNARVTAWWVMVAVFGAAAALGPWGTLALFAIVSFFVLREVVTLTPTRPGDRYALFACFFVVLPVQYVLIAANWYGLFSIFVPVYAFLLLPAIAAMSGDTERFLERGAEMQWGLMIAVFCISHAPALLTLDIPGYSGRNGLLLMYLLLVVQMSDVFQYVVGMLAGKRRIAPTVSPSKTWEGFVGGTLLATALGAGLWWITPFTPAQSAAMAAVVVTMGFLGGLSLSAVKRGLGVKDWGATIPGHGGVLDRFDSVVFAAPIFFHLTRYFFAPGLLAP